MTVTRQSRWVRIRTRAADLGAGLLGWIGENLLITLFLTALFFIGPAVLQPSSPGEETTLTNATGLIEKKQLTGAVLRDQDARLEFTTLAGNRWWTAYPHSDAYTATLLGQLQSAKVPTV